MLKNHNFFWKGAAIPLSLTVAGVASLIALLGLMANSFNAFPQADMRTESKSSTLIVGDQFEVKVVVESSIPVNAFEGDLSFDREVLSVASISYNTSIADLWVKEPWYSNGAGTINFAGGTTREGGFTGTDTLLTITFNTLKEGAGFIGITNARILQHDGLGSETTLKEPIDAVFTVTSPPNSTLDVLHKTDAKSTWFTVQEEKVSPDLNGDGKQTIADVSIFMIQLINQNMRSDLNKDGKVTIADLSILLDSQ